MTEEMLFESERETTADDAAAALRRVATALEEGSGLAFGDDVVVPGPTDLELEIELERQDGEYELEFELEWDDPDASERESAAQGDEEDADEEDAAADREGDDDPIESEPAAVAAGEAGDLTALQASQATFEAFQDKADEWRWRLVHRNGRIVADSGEGYTTRRNLEKGIRSVKRNAPGAPIEYEEAEE